MRGVILRSEFWQKRSLDVDRFTTSCRASLVYLTKSWLYRLLKEERVRRMLNYDRARVAPDSPAMLAPNTVPSDPQLDVPIRRDSKLKERRRSSADLQGTKRGQIMRSTSVADGGATSKYPAAYAKTRRLSTVGGETSQQRTLRRSTL